jgi:hypothetical protein
VTGAVLALPARVGAHSRGIQASGCQSCHGSDLMAGVAVSADRASIEPGELVTFTATVTRAGARVGGIYVAEPTAGTLSTQSGEGLTLSARALTHTSPKAASGDNVIFTFHWQAPSTPGATELRVYALAANGNGNSTGDAPAQGVFPYTFGCTPRTLYFDADGDGHGATDFAATLGCADQPPTVGYAPESDDCDDGHDQVFPGALERCNGRDDDCNGMIDDGAKPEELFPDPDGDGVYGGNPGASVIGCLPLAGYANQPGDCAPDDPARYPGATEVCNLFDDDCDGRVDEYVRPRCGVGLCEREGPSCDAADCIAGTPRAETCNQLDDDCNGEPDDGELCGSGQACLGGECATLGDGGTGTGGTGGASQVAASGAGGSRGGAPATGGVTGAGTAAGMSPAVPAPTSPAVPAPTSPAGCTIARARGNPTPLWALLALAILAALPSCRARSKRHVLPKALPARAVDPHLIKLPPLASGPTRPLLPPREACWLELEGPAARTITGTFFASTPRDPMTDVQASSDYWASESDLRRVLGARASVFATDEEAQQKLARAMASDPRQHILRLGCLTDEGGITLMTGDRSHYRDVPFGPGRYRISAADMAAAAPGEFVAQTVRTGRLDYYQAQGGELELTRFDPEGVAGSFMLTAAAAPGEPTLTVKGRFAFPCDPLDASGCSAKP